MKKFVYCGPCTPEEISGPYETPPPDASTTELADIGASLKKGATLHLVYDVYGGTTEHTFTVQSVKTIKKESNQEFPRRKPLPLLRFKLVTDEVDLDDDYSALNSWTCERSRSVEVNIFQAGRMHHYGYLETENLYEGRMIYLPEKPQSLNHYLECLDVGARVPKTGPADWHSVVVLPEGSKNVDKYCSQLEEGLFDCKVVAESHDGTPDLATIFPKVAALAGYRKDKTVKKGWIRYRTTRS